MKIKQKIAGLTLIVSMLTGIGHAQTNESVVNWEADVAGLSALSAGDVPKSGTFWLVTPPNGNNGGMLPPYPCLPTDFDAGNIYTLPSGAFLVDATGGNDGTDSLQLAAQILSVSNIIQQSETVATSQAMGMRAMDLSGPPGFDDTNDDGYTPSDVTNTPIAIDYGTNLWIAQWNLTSNNVTGIASNTVADISYELMTNSDLTTTNWGHTGQFILGSEVTNWTALNSFPISLTNNLFFQLLSYVSSDGSGLPDWWEIEYFGMMGIDPYGDPMGDGYSNLYKYQNGMNPNVFYQPAAPQGFTATYNATTGTANLTWFPSPGNVANYVLTTPNGATVTLSASTTSYADNDPTLASNLEQTIINSGFFNPPSITEFQLVADYGSVPSAPAAANLLVSAPGIWLVQGAQGSNILAAAMSTLPSGTTAIRWTRYDWYASQAFGDDSSFNFSNDIPLTAFTNGLYVLPPDWLATPDDGYPIGQFAYSWSVQTVNSNGTPTSQAGFIGNSYNLPNSPVVNANSPPVNPIYLDGRAQLKQNLKFLLRAATTDNSFGYYTIGADGSSFGLGSPRTFSTNYAEASFYQNQSLRENSYYPNTSPVLDNFQPFEDNYLYENCVLNSSLLNGGQLMTGISSENYGIPDSYTIFSSTLTYTFNAPTVSGTPVSALGPDEANWLMTGKNAFNSSYQYGIGLDDVDEAPTNVMVNAKNIFGLSFVSIEAAWNNGSGGTATNTLYPGEGTTQSEWFYPQTEQPSLQMVEYDFWNYGYYDASYNFHQTDVLPEESGFSPTNQSDNCLIAALGSTLQVAGYAKVAVTNGYPGTYGYVGQYFTNAYVIGTNGIPTTNTTGILSPFGAFFPTQPGPTALVTMPDIDPPYEQGTCTVSCVSLNVDKNHDGTMDLSLFGADTTSQSSPMECWINNRYCTADGDLVATNGVSPNYSFGEITGLRDLENFFRLWICGMPQLTNGYQVTLSWTNVSSGNPSINLYSSSDSDGGTGYLTDTNIAANQARTYMSPNPAFGFELATITNQQSYTLPENFFDENYPYYSRFLFEGAGIGAGELVLTITDANSNQIAQTGVWLDLHDVDDFFQRVKVTPRDPSGIPAPYNESSTFDETTAGVDISSDEHPFQPPQNEDSSATVFVHGSNVSVPVAIDNAESMFKRLYWQGYTGRFILFYWNTLVGAFSGKIPAHYNYNEYRALKYGLALKNYVENDLPAGYTKNVIGHSMGNMVVTSALYPRGSTPGMTANNVIFMQAALPASCYDPNATTLSSLTQLEDPQTTPDEFAAQWGYRGLCATNVNATLYNIYNPQDYALGYWVDNQGINKPEDLWHPLSYVPYYYAWNTTNGGSLNNWQQSMLSGLYDVPGSEIRAVTDPQESISMIARSRTAALGTMAVNGNIGTTNCLNVGIGTSFTYPLGNLRPDHSGEFTRPIQQLNQFYNYIYLIIR